MSITTIPSSSSSGRAHSSPRRPPGDRASPGGAGAAGAAVATGAAGAAGATRDGSHGFAAAAAAAAAATAAAVAAAFASTEGDRAPFVPTCGGRASTGLSGGRSGTSAATASIGESFAETSFSSSPRRDGAPDLALGFDGETPLSIGVAADAD